MVPNQALKLLTLVLRNRLRGSSAASALAESAVVVSALAAPAVKVCCRYVSISPLFILASNTSASPFLRLLGPSAGALLGARLGARLGALARLPMRSRISTRPYTGGPNLACMLANSRSTWAFRISALIDGLGRFGAL